MVEIHSSVEIRSSIEKGVSHMDLGVYKKLATKFLEHNEISIAAFDTQVQMYEALKGENRFLPAVDAFIVELRKFQKYLASIKATFIQLIGEEVDYAINLSSSLVEQKRIDPSFDYDPKETPQESYDTFQLAGSRLVKAMNIPLDHHIDEVARLLVRAETARQLVSSSIFLP